MKERKKERKEGSENEGKKSMEDRKK